ncbi:branched-chain amino acid aminotransferase [Clostridium gelidum]|uniref:Branched-chain amino acid aminotransferase n=1 Tax=Clostridium gelidum TaxID=704125 RepID=A0ABN6J535_9CLOT|nr:aminotransferase class IV [Clostridium gelidum]BCZ48650.1 branched-chain amino acid aminotransferase [Clostridium gelidum]
MEEKIIYEVLRVINGKSIFLENHLSRMKNSFELINEKFTLTYEEISRKIDDLIKSENKVEGNIKITYGVHEKILKIFFIKHSYPSNEMYDTGVKTILYFGERNNPNAKIVDDNFREKVNSEIKEKNVYEAILVNQNGYITEGSKSNIFMVKDNELLTSPINEVLPGVTRGKIIKIAEKLGIKVKEVEYKYSDIDKLDGMFISGTSPNILPIKSVNNINLDSNNDIIRKLAIEYDNDISQYLKNH